MDLMGAGFASLRVRDGLASVTDPVVVLRADWGACGRG